jgi:hypothetical protein
MIKAVKKDTGSVVFMRLQKHACPQCQRQLKVVKMKKVVRAKSAEAKNFDFTACGSPLGEKVKFVWYEFKCRECDKRFTEAEIKAHEKQVKKEAKKAAKAAKKEAKKAAKKQKKDG